VPRTRRFGGRPEAEEFGVGSTLLNSPLRGI